MRLRGRNRRPRRPADPPPGPTGQELLSLLPVPDAPDWVTGADLTTGPPPGFFPPPTTPVPTRPAPTGTTSATSSPTPQARSAASPPAPGAAASTSTAPPAAQPAAGPTTESSTESSTRSSAGRSAPTPAQPPAPAEPSGDTKAPNAAAAHPRAPKQAAPAAFPDDKLVASGRGLDASAPPRREPATAPVEPEPPGPAAAPPSIRALSKPPHLADATPSEANRPAATPSPQATPVPSDAPQIAVLGPVRVTGQALPDLPGAHRAALTELAAWIALHPGADPATLSAALGFTSPGVITAALFHLRQWLGVDPAGRPYLLPKKRREPYRLADTVGCDWDQFQRLAARGRSLLTTDHHAGIGALRQALDLVRGRPLITGDGPDGGAYPWAAQLSEQMAGAIVEAAHTAAAAALSTGDPGTAEALLRQGLAGAPDNQRLLRDLLTCAERSSNHSHQSQTIQLVERHLRERGLRPQAETIAHLERLRAQLPAPAPISRSGRVRGSRPDLDR